MSILKLYDDVWIKCDLAAPPAQRTVVIGANSAWNVVNFRKPIIEALIAAGWRVVAPGA